MLYLIGLGLYDEKDMSIRALEILRSADTVYAEFYTNVFNGSLKNLEKLIGKHVTSLKRSDIEERPQENLLKDPTEETVLLVSGDPMVATTHSDILLRARKKGFETRVIHASSVYSSVAETGLQIYKFGKTASIPYPEGNYFPTSPYDLLEVNLSVGMHTLFLLDVRTNENRFMTVNEAISLLLEMEKLKQKNLFTKETLCVGAACLGGDPVILSGSAGDLLNADFGRNPHILIVPGNLHFMEEELLETLAYDPNH